MYGSTCVRRSPTPASLTCGRAPVIRIITQPWPRCGGGNHPVRRSGQAVAEGIRSRIDLAAGADLGIEVIDVALNGADAQHQLVRDLAVTPSGCHQAQYFQLPRSESLGISWATRYRGFGRTLAENRGLGTQHFGYGFSQ